MKLIERFFGKNPIDLIKKQLERLDWIPYDPFRGEGSAIAGEYRWYAVNDQSDHELIKKVLMSNSVLTTADMMDVLECSIPERICLRFQENSVEYITCYSIMVNRARALHKVFSPYITAQQESGPDNEKIKTILVDDDEMHREKIQKIFEGTNIEIVMEKKNPEGLLETINQEKATLVIMDVYMDPFNGIETLKLIRDTVKEVCFVIMSSSKMEIYPAMAAGADAFVHKWKSDMQIHDEILSAVSRKLSFGL